MCVSEGEAPLIKHSITQTASYLSCWRCRLKPQLVLSSSPNGGSHIQTIKQQRQPFIVRPTFYCSQFSSGAGKFKGTLGISSEWRAKAVYFKHCVLPSAAPQRKLPQLRNSSIRLLLQSIQSCTVKLAQHSQLTHRHAFPTFLSFKISNEDRRYFWHSAFKNDLHKIQHNQK